MPQLITDGNETAPFEVIADYACETGENPLWHRAERKLYWTDIPAGRLFRYDPATGKHEQCYRGRPVGGFTVQIDGSLLLFMDRGTVARWQDGALLEIVPDLPAERASRFNDVIADPMGRVFCGTMSTSESKGRLYRLDCDASFHLLLEEVGCSNGMAFGIDGKTFYYTDSFAYEIYAFDYAVEDGTIRNRRVFARFNEANGMPDGITIDSEGSLWIAFWDGGGIMRVSPDGSRDSKISLPAAKISSLTFGGADCRDLYVTSAGGDRKTTEGELAGALFRLRLGVAGVPEFLSAINCLSKQEVEGE